MLTVAVQDHLGKSHRLSRALHLAGHELVSEPPAELLLIDLDPPVFGRREIIDRYKDEGATVWLYPHGGGVALEYDGLYEPYEKVDGQFVIGPGYAEFLRRIEVPRPAHVIGWCYCDMAPFRPRTDVRSVLFAPTHPSGFGTMAEWHREMNVVTFERLLEGPWDVTVRYIGSLEQNGLREADGVRYVVGDMNLDHSDIDAADAVVAGEGTFPSMAIARGVPTVMCAQVKPVMYGLPGEKPTKLRHPERYADYIRYPLDVEDGPLDELLNTAARGEEPIAAWKRRFVGRPFSPGAFSRLVERVATAPPEPAIEETRSFTVAGFADELSERPELLARYARSFGPDDDATLVLWGPGYDDGALLDLVQTAVVRAGVDESALPDILLLAGSTDTDRAIAQRAGALLSEWPPGRLGELPRFGAEDAEGLRAAATRAWG